MSWYSGCMKVLADNKELIPEFYLGDGMFMRNCNRVELGKDHREETVGDVGLPPWAKDVDEYIIKNREALECNHTSAHLHLWLDLLFGYAQSPTSDQASLSNNLFQPSTYSQNIDFASLSSKLER